MSKKYVVYVTYGVYVDYPTDFDPNQSDENFDQLKRDAVAKMFSHGQVEVGANAEIEFEDVTEEFQEID